VEEVAEPIVHVQQVLLKLLQTLSELRDILIVQIYPAQSFTLFFCSEFPVHLSLFLRDHSLHSLFLLVLHVDFLAERFHPFKNQVVIGL
jgi:hypothetical protein